MPRISVLMPCRDAAPCIDDSLASLSAQTFTDFEVIVVDDGSLDDTAARIERWSAEDRRIRAVPADGRGIVDALRCASRHASGEIIARMDADDIAHPLRFEKQLERLSAIPSIDACGTGVRYFPRQDIRDGALRYEGWLNSLIEPAAIARDMFVECPIAHPSLMIRREALDGAGGYIDRGWPEDYDLLFRLWALGRSMASTREVLLDWRDRPDRLSRTDLRYAPAAFRRCKSFYLRHHLLAGRDVVVWGAGPVGKAFARQLLADGAAVRAFVDLDPRKIGQIVHQAPVIGPSSLDPSVDAFVVAAVGSARGRAGIRADLLARGKVEMRDFCAVA
jgi:glycosyltransferase involved in cell wall biosynthesis